MRRFSFQIEITKKFEILKIKVGKVAFLFMLEYWDCNGANRDRVRAAQCAIKT